MKINNKVTLSVAIAAHNEENNLSACLESVAGLADEIVVVDGESDDKTIQIANSYNAHVISAPNKKMFHINKNLAINNCQGKWILLLDADERVSEHLASEIKKVTNSKTSESGFWINRKNWFLGDFLKKGGAYPDPVIRLFKRGKGHLPEKSVHEQVEIIGPVGHFKSDLIHIADPNFKRYLERANRYTDLTANDLEKNKVGSGILTIINYFFLKPVATFFNIYLLNKGFEDGYRGFIWALFSGFHHYIAYAKYWRKLQN